GGRNVELVVIVARDSTVEKRKGFKPVMSENQRRALVEALEVVDEAVLGYKDFDIGKVIEMIKPDVIAVGHDQEGVERMIRGYVREKELNIKIVKISKFGEDELSSSSEIKRKIIEHFRR
ncbi:FAD synthase, partial [Candidatus Bathyarchaeota archaeon]|nr:FAD synthase [Candidatus Bathyarchaeota archaeon]